jgi:hypothetical protein
VPFSVSVQESRGYQWQFIVPFAYAICLIAGPASAQAISELAKNLDPNFQSILAEPSNVSAEIKYAVGATQGGDIEIAISSFERLLFYNPTSSQIRIELGMLYFRLSSYDMARGYFESALKMHDLTPELRRRAEQLLAATNKRLQPDQYNGFVQSGLRYQTNATAGPGQQQLLASGATFNNRFLAHPDGNWFGAFGVNYSRDLGTQTSDTFEASAIGYDAQQFTQHQVDTGLVELRAGPRFGILSDSPTDTSFKPYVVATGSLLADTTFSGGVGGGATTRLHLGSIILDPYVEVVQRNYHSSFYYPLAGNLDGTLQTYAFQASAPLVSGWGVQSRLSFAHDNTEYAPYSYNAFSADLWLPWSFSPAWDTRAWILTPNIGVTDWLYQQPDPMVAPTITQHTFEWRLGLNLEIPIRDQLYLGLLGQYRAVISNVAVYSMRDLALTAGPTFRF